VGPQGGYEGPQGGYGSSQGGYYAPGPQMGYGGYPQQRQMGYQQQGAYGGGYNGGGGYYGSPQGGYADNRRGGSGFMEAMLASLACCCCLDCLLF